jgi:hypothetical protein
MVCKHSRQDHEAWCGGEGGKIESLKHSDYHGFGVGWGGTNKHLNRAG